MTQYPDYLSPLVDSHNSVKEFTATSVSYTYELFIESLAKKKKIKIKNNEATVNPDYKFDLSPEDNLLKFVVEDQVFIPVNLTKNYIPAEKFLKRFLSELQKNYKLLEGNRIPAELQKLSSKNSKISFHPPKIIGHPDPEYWVFPILKRIAEEGHIWLTQESSVDSENKVTTKFHFPSQIIEDMQIKKAVFDMFLHQVNDDQWQRYVIIGSPHTPEFRKELIQPGKIVGGSSIWLGGAATGSALAFTVTPTLGTLSVITAGVIALVAGGQALLQSANMKHSRLIKLTPDGEKLVKDYQAWENYNNRKSNSTDYTTMNALTD